MKIHILHTNDVHSQLENQMRVGHALRSLRSQLRSDSQPVLTFDIGDVLDRVRPETEASLGRLNAELLGALGVDGWVFGNNEGLTVPADVWPELAQKSQSTVFGTNIRDESGNQLPDFKDYQIFDISGVTIGVFGVTPLYVKPYEHLGVTILDPVKEAARAVSALRGRGVDIVIALSHLGLRVDHALAVDVPGIDVILGGHTHQLMDAPVYEGHTAIFQVGKYGMAFGHTTLTVDDASHELLRVTGCPIRPHVLEPVDADMWSTYQSYNASITEYLDTPVCDLCAPLETSLTEESSFANLLAEILWHEYSSDGQSVDGQSVDGALFVSGLLGASLLAGTVRKRHIHAACSTPTRPAIINVQGRDLLALFERALQPEFSSQRGFGFGFRGSVVGHIGVANITITAHQSASGNVVLDEVFIGAQALDEDKVYRIATTEYLWLAPVFPEIRLCPDVDIPPPLLRDLLMTRMHDAQLVSDARVSRIHIEAKPR